MADFASWKHESLVKFAEESQKDQITQANKHAQVLKVLKDLMDDYARLSDQFCCNPERQAQYRAAKEIFKV